jgi:shikimate dehydrogenase
MGSSPLTARTRVVGVIGNPVVHSRSPAMHNAAFAALGLDWVYVAFPVPRGRARQAVAAVPALGLAGLNVTMPHKADAARVCDDLSSEAAALASVNTVVARDDGKILGASTDGAGFLRALAEVGVDTSGRRCLVVGAGGAARAVALAAGGTGARVTVAARRPDAAAAAARLANGEAVALAGIDVSPYDIVVNATPVGMGGEAPPLDTTALHSGQFVFDTVYPGETPLLAAARARGARCAGGLGMLVHQGALSFELWTGAPAPVDIMRRAAEEMPS